MRRRLLSWMLIVVAVGVGLGSCNSDSGNYLEGSLGDSYDLEFETTRIRLYQSELSIEYIADPEHTEKVALRVTISRIGGDIYEGANYDLKLRGNIGRGEGYGSSLPPMESGELDLITFDPLVGGEVNGQFEAVFLMTDGSQLSLRGGFVSELEIVDI